MNFMRNSRSLINEIREIVKEEMKNVEPSHDFSHVMRVYKLCMEIAKEYKDNVDLEVLKLAALLHDIAREREDKDKTGKICHAIESAKEAERILKKLKYPEKKIEKISEHTPLIEIEIKSKYIPKKLYTKKAKKMAKERVKFMKEFVKTLEKEIKRKC